MVRHYKIVDGGYLVLIGTGDGGKEITEEEYGNIMSVIKTKPTESLTVGYRLKEDLTWEAYDKEPAPEDEPTAEEIVSILTGEAE